MMSRAHSRTPCQIVHLFILSTEWCEEDNALSLSLATAFCRIFSVFIRPLVAGNIHTNWIPLWYMMLICCMRLIVGSRFIWLFLFMLVRIVLAIVRPNVCLKTGQKCVWNTRIMLMKIQLALFTVILIFCHCFFHLIGLLVGECHRIGVHISAWSVCCYKPFGCRH